jgi:hypothetical protein
VGSSAESYGNFRDVEDGREGLVQDNGSVVLDRHDGGLHKVAGPVRLHLAAGDDLAALLLGLGDGVLVEIDGGGAVEGTEESVLLERVAHLLAQLLVSGLETAQELIVDLLVQELLTART